MKKQQWLTTLALVMSAGVPSAYAANYEVLAPGALHEGKTIAEWTAAWWTWAWNSPAGADPLSDSSGALANQNNGGPVFFMAGSNSNGAVVRAFDVPGGRALLVPMINYWENCVGDIAISCAPNYVPDPGAVLLANSETYRSAVTHSFVTIDSTPVPDPLTHWEVSSVFSGGVAQPGTILVALYAGAGIDITGLDISPSLVSGYYAMVTGLSPGTHTITYGGATNAFGGFNYQVTANINVLAVPEPEMVGLLLAGLGTVGWCARRRGMQSAR